MRPREGALKIKRTLLPIWEGIISTSSALRWPSFSTTVPENSSSTSTTTSSNGSSSCPFSSRFIKTRGREIDSSKPSRRMVSIRTPSCNSPRPATSNESEESVREILRAMLPSASLHRRSQIMREVTLSPSRPASGESLIEKVMAKVGGSIGCALIDWLTSSAQMVSATVPLTMPATATMSPAWASSRATRSKPR